jgi:uncharacterized protein YcbX
LQDGLRFGNTPGVPPTNRDMNTRCIINELNLYPVKSCRGLSLQLATVSVTGFDHDRRWMIASDSGRFLTQRELPRMALIIPSLTPAGLSLSAPGMPALEVPTEPAGTMEVTVLLDRLTAHDMGATSARWLSDFLERPVKLVRFASEATRPSHPRFWKADIASGIEFSDAFPFLVISRASLDDLNSRLATPLPMNRFRPNIVVDDLEPYGEDRIRVLNVGNLQLRMVRPCTRCKITTTNQMTGEVAGTEPLMTLKSYRWSDDLRGIMFGHYAVVVAGAGTTLHVGQQFGIEWR